MTATHDKDTITVSEITAQLTSDATRLKHTAFVGPSHEQVLKNLLTQFEKQDFRALAKLDEDEKLNVSDYHVLVSEQVLTLARSNHWNICRRTDFFYLYNGGILESSRPR